MAVNINPNTTVQISPSQIIQTPEMRNAGTMQNAGTTQQFRSNVASGIGQGVGTAIQRPTTRSVASGVGQGVGQAAVITAEFVKSGQTVKIPSIRKQAFNDIQNAGTIQNSGATIDITEGGNIEPLASGSGLGLGQATQQEKRFKRASGSGQGVGTAIERPFRLLDASGSGQGVGTAIQRPTTRTIASGSGQGFGQATKVRTAFTQASGIGQGIGTAIERPFRLLDVSGFGLGIGQATPLRVFDPIQHAVNILDDITASELKLPKPERIAPIWQYSHNDRVNYPDPALYVYAPTESTIDKFSIDADTTNQTNTIEILIMTLAQERTRAYQQSFVRYLTKFYDDNQTETGFHRFENITASDIRNEHIAQQTDHYIASITVEVQRFVDVDV